MKIVGGAGYSDDLRERIVNAVYNGENVRKVADIYKVNRLTVFLYLEKDTAGTLYSRGRSGGRPRKVLPEHEEQLIRQFNVYPDATLQEHADMLLEATGLKISFKTVDRVLRRNKITHKKNSNS